MSKELKIILTADSSQAASTLQKFGKDAEGIASQVKSALLSIGTGLIVRELTNMADDYSNLQARLKLATRSAEEFAAANAAIQRIANASQAPLLETATLYTRIAGSLKDTSVSQAEMVDTSEAIALSLRISGASAAEAASVMLQFSQAVASGVLRGEEFNAMAEGAPRAMQALAKSLGVSVGALRDMAKEGKLTREVLIDGLARQLPELRKEAESLPTTFGAAFTELNNTLLLTVGQINEVTGSSKTLAQSLLDIGKPAILTTFQTLGVLGANVAYVFEQAGRGIGGAAAQLQAMGRLDFQGVRAIREAMRKDFAEAESRLIGIEKRIMGLGAETGRAAASTVAGGSGPARTLPGPGKSKSAKTRATKKPELDQIDPYAKQREQFEQEALRATVAEQARLFDEMAAMRDYQIAQDEKAAAALGRMREAMVDVIDPLQRYRDELDKVDDLVAAGMFTPEQAAAARMYWNEQMDAAAGFGQLVQDDVRKAIDLNKELAMTFTSAFEDAVVGGEKFRDILDSIAQDITRIFIRKTVTEPIGNAIAGFFKDFNFGSLFAKGGVPGGHGLHAYANQVVDRPTLFPFARGVGLMGEAGPEAILPLRRGPGGRLGVEASTSSAAGQDRAVIIHMNVQATDAGSFRRSMGQIKADLAFAVGSAQRNL
ncbi:MAG: tape measure protein [Thiobacillaceae bacterium]|nr:tape measure protein [Thiobacillaceae bacterium]